MSFKDDIDYASTSNNNWTETAIKKQQALELEEIENALSKIKNSVYGICDMCEEDIDINRLLAKPHAIYCIDCREVSELKR